MTKSGNIQKGRSRVENVIMRMDFPTKGSSMYVIRNLCTCHRVKWYWPDNAVLYYSHLMRLMFFPMNRTDAIGGRLIDFTIKRGDKAKPLNFTFYRNENNSKSRY